MYIYYIYIIYVYRKENDWLIVVCSSETYFHNLVIDIFFYILFFVTLIC